ncbi:MAG: GDP-mannose 4,6-dehydratase [Gemmatales bacterium]|nr:GDP-mannose 4,6-dehydratase [Gemmatales bacterium]MDW8386576.1 GDP-mannose 4,6-dehydratase [Gemmatales bacterium]
MNLKGCTVLVTGAGGFIGSHLVERLVREGCRVRAMLHYDSRADRGNLEHVPSEVLGEVEILRGDVTDSHFMLRAVDGCAVVFHLAALIAIPYSYQAPGAFVQTNVVGTLNVLEACRWHRTPRLVHTSTSECYGTAQYTPIDEQHPLVGQSPYSASKIAADKLVESYHLSFGVPAVVLRPFNTFGPRQSARAVIPSILAQLLAGASQLRLGDLTPVRDMNYVINTVDAFVAAAERDEAVGQVVHVGTGRGVSIGELAELAMRTVGRTVPIVTDHQRLRPPGSEVRLLLCNWSRAEKLLGWRPTVGLEEGMEHTARFVRDHLGQYRPQEYAV